MNPEKLNFTPEDEIKFAKIYSNEKSNLLFGGIKTLILIIFFPFIGVLLVPDLIESINWPPTSIKEYLELLLFSLITFTPLFFLSFRNYFKLLHDQNKKQKTVHSVTVIDKLKIDDNKFFITYSPNVGKKIIKSPISIKQYNQLNPGDRIAIELSYKYHQVLKIELLEKNTFELSKTAESTITLEAKNTNYFKLHLSYFVLLTFFLSILFICFAAPFISPVGLLFTFILSPFIIIILKRSLKSKSVYKVCLDTNSKKVVFHYFYPLSPKKRVSEINPRKFIVSIETTRKHRDSIRTFLTLFELKNRRLGKKKFELITFFLGWQKEKLYELNELLLMCGVRQKKG